jgi:hypothetical protein
MAILTYLFLDFFLYASAKGGTEWAGRADPSGEGIGGG